MSSDLEGLKIQIADTINQGIGQTTSKLRDRVTMLPVEGKTITYTDIDVFGDANKRTQGIQKTAAKQATFNRRGAHVEAWDNPVVHPEFDVLRGLGDPKSAISQGLTRSIKRAIDLKIISGMTGAVLTGENFTTSVTAAADGVQTIAHGSVGLTWEKINTLQQNFMNSGVVDDVDPNEFGAQAYLGVDSSAYAQLSAQAEFNDKDFAHNFTRAPNGMLQRVGIFEIVHFATSPLEGTSVIPISGNIVSNIAWTKRSVGLGILSDITVDIDKRPDLNNAWQIFPSIKFNALRCVGTGVQIVQSDKSVAPVA